MQKHSWKFGWNWVAFRCVIFGVSALIIWVFVIGIGSNQPGSFFNKKHNAVWIGHEWVGKKKSESEIRDLVANLKKWQIDTVFVHAGPLLEAGDIEPETDQYAVYFLETARKYGPEIKYQAWLGQLRYKIDLGDATVRHNVVKQASVLTVGFDGVHLDIEPVWDGDKDFILLLKEIREKLPKEKHISVAMAEFIPSSVVWFVEDFHKFENYNSQVNYLNVAQYADQIVVMIYDTGIQRDWLYKWLVKEQTIWVTALLSGKEVFIAVPAYKKPGAGFNPVVENVRNGLKGITDGLNNLRSNERNFAGVAIYPYWELGEGDLKAYQELWLAK